MIGGRVKRNDFRLPNVDGESIPCGIGAEMCKHLVKSLRGGGKEDQIVSIEKARDEGGRPHQLGAHAVGVEKSLM